MCTRSKRVRHCFHIAVLLALSFFSVSCVILGLRKHVEKMEAHGAITIQVSPVPSTAPTYALAWTSANGEKPQSAGLQQVGPDGIASFLLRIDRTYAVGAFTDLNRNHAYDVGEPADYIKDIRPLSLSDPNVQPRMLKLNFSRVMDCRQVLP